jgi:hypothetical protein
MSSSSFRLTGNNMYCHHVLQSLRVGAAAVVVVAVGVVGVVVVDVGCGC